jgi:tRNA nucleotidyltransferase (CCA-adding enzyme)
MFIFYKVGGCIRDKLLGKKHNDTDFTVISPDGVDLIYVLEKYLHERGFVTVIIIPECLTIKTKFVSVTELVFPFEVMKGNIYDFNITRKEIEYDFKSRVPKMSIGNLFDDLQRRDFTINSLAQDKNGKILDYFNGVNDINNKIIRTTIDPEISMQQDPLRILRAIRFSITLDLTIEDSLSKIIEEFDYSHMNIIPLNKILKELKLSFNHDSFKTLKMLNKYNNLQKYLFEKNVILVPKIK